MRTLVTAAAMTACFFTLVDCGPKADANSDSGTPGKPGGPCLSNGTCDPGLRCTPNGCIATSGGAGGNQQGGGGVPPGGGSGGGGIVPPGGGGVGTGSAPGGGGVGTGNAPGGGGVGTGNVTGGGGVFSAGGAPTSTGGFGQCGGTITDPSGLAPCSTCSGGRCVPVADYPSAPLQILDECGTGNVCMPDSIVATKGNVLLPTCTSVAGIEGRCASLCIPIVRSLSGVLPQGGCGPDDRCAPCSNPADGSWTGICSVGCDPGPSQPAFKFASCCADRGRCVPRGDIPSPAAASLPKLDCTGGNDPVCVPAQSVTDPTYKFPPCTSVGQAGVCAPDCIVNAVPNGNLVGRGDCASATDKCAPCTNPLTGQPTGACGP